MSDTTTAPVLIGSVETGYRIAQVEWPGRETAEAQRAELAALRDLDMERLRHGLAAEAAWQLQGLADQLEAARRDFEQNQVQLDEQVRQGQQVQELALECAEQTARATQIATETAQAVERTQREATEAQQRLDELMARQQYEAVEEASRIARWAAEQVDQTTRQAAEAAAALTALQTAADDARMAFQLAVDQANATHAQAQLAHANALAAAHRLEDFVAHTPAASAPGGRVSWAIAGAVFPGLLPVIGPLAAWGAAKEYGASRAQRRALGVGLVASGAAQAFGATAVAGTLGGGPAMGLLAAAVFNAVAGVAVARGGSGRGGQEDGVPEPRPEPPVPVKMVEYLPAGFVLPDLKLRKPIEGDPRFAWATQQPFDTHCKIASNKMLRPFGIVSGASGQEFLVAKRLYTAADAPPRTSDRLYLGYVNRETGIDKAAAAAGIEYLKEQLGAHRLVVVGVVHKSVDDQRPAPKSNPDGVTKHFVVVTGVSADGKRFSFRDPSPWREADSFGVFDLDDDGMLVRPGSPDGRWVTERRFEVTTIRKNFPLPSTP